LAQSGHHDRAGDEITRSIIGATSPGIVAAEIQRAQGKDAAQLGQWERVIRFWHLRAMPIASTAFGSKADITERDVTTQSGLGGTNKTSPAF
jgi:hypothetical protein